MKTKQTLQASGLMFKPYKRPLSGPLLEFLGEEADAVRDIQYAAAMSLQKDPDQFRKNLLEKIQKLAAVQIGSESYLRDHVHNADEKARFKVKQNAFFSSLAPQLQEITKVAFAYSQAEAGAVKETQADVLVGLATELGLSEHKRVMATQPPAPPVAKRSRRLSHL
jgi:hypothetical protein